MLWQQLQIAPELQSELQDTEDLGSMWFVDFNTGKTQLVSFNPFNNPGAINVKVEGSVLE